MLDGVNDQPEHARQLVDLVQAPRGARRVVQVQPDSFQPVSRLRAGAFRQQQVRHFAKFLSDAGIVTTVRKTRGDDIDAACGQLAGDVKDRTVSASAWRSSAR
jgi:23S rRNA (adenine2503-C2)-methyltransferase